MVTSLNLVPVSFLFSEFRDILNVVSLSSCPAYKDMLCNSSSTLSFRDPFGQNSSVSATPLWFLVLGTQSGSKTSPLRPGPPLWSADGDWWRLPQGKPELPMYAACFCLSCSPVHCQGSQMLTSTSRRQLCSPVDNFQTHFRMCNFGGKRVKAEHYYALFYFIFPSLFDIGSCHVV
jgi:hypothetical protein